MLCCAIDVYFRKVSYKIFVLFIPWNLDSLYLKVIQVHTSFVSCNVVDRKYIIYAYRRHKKRKGKLTQWKTLLAPRMEIIAIAIAGLEPPFPLYTHKQLAE